MQQRSHVLAPVRAASAAVLTITLLGGLTACGGGGGSSNNGPTATVSSMSVAATRYGASALVTIAGTGLTNLTVSSTGCKAMTRLTAAPTASTDTTAYYSCTPSGAYSSTVVAASNGSTVGSQNFTVPAPIVTMAVSGGGVNGNIVFTLKGDKAPITVDNFLNYVNSGFYTGLIFHRVAPGFVVQGGGYGAATSGTLPTPKATTFAPIALELTGGSNVQWTVAMARTSSPNSATSQFFFNIANNASILDSQGFAVFADVTASASVIQQIAAAPCTPLVGTGLTDGSCVPIPNVVITSATQTQ
jgi:peptidyl-prolyl cis-trans isomerase A (cyclophilin A)